MMGFKERYEKGKEELLTDNSICKENRDLFSKFFDYQEIKLRRMNGLAKVDEASYKTLYTYVYRFRIVNGWFDNTPLPKITKKQFDKVFNNLCDGKIKNSNGKPIKDIDSYVYKIFKSKLFKLAGLTNIVEESLEFYKSNHKTVANFIEEKNMMMIIEHISKPKMKTLITLAFDIGENVSSLLLLKKKDFRREFNPVTKEYEYHIHLRKDNLKRSRLERTEITRLQKSVELLDFMLKDLDNEEYIFTREDNMVRSDGVVVKDIPLSLRSAEIFFERVVEKLGIKTIPKGERPKLKDIRSSMACDCLKKDWTREEINSRLGHSINSRVLEPYVNFLALDKQKPKVREYKENIQGLNEKMVEQKNVNSILDKKVKEQENEIDKLKEEYKKVSFEKEDMNKKIDMLMKFYETYQEEMDNLADNPNLKVSELYENIQKRTTEDKKKMFGYIKKS